MVDVALVRAYVQNAQAVLENGQPQHAALLLARVMELLKEQNHAFPVQLSVGIGLHAGSKRSSNEDYIFAAQSHRVLANGALEPFGIFVVADGMGGHAYGQEASRQAVHALVDFIFPRLRISQAQGTALQALLSKGVQAANQAVYQCNQQLGAHCQTEKMGTTITVLLTVGPEAWIANVGDSRLYLLHDGVFAPITRDHSVVADLLVSGAIIPADVYTHPKRNVIYRSLGAVERVEVDIFPGQVQDGDVLLLCSDGLWEMVPDPMKIAAILASFWLSADQMAEQLVHLALAGGGRDNIAALVVQVHMDIAGLQTIVTPLSDSPALAF